jgi:hypothetical protein
MITSMTPNPHREAVAQFTEGPWRVQGGEVVSQHDPICSMPVLYRASKEARAVLEADANLIAAAPELYEALELIVEQREAFFTEHAWKAAEAALAKARGESA